MIVQLKAHKMKISKPKVWLGIYLFILVFQPPIIPKINVYHLLTIFSLFCLIVEYKSLFKNFYRQSNVKKLLKGMGLYFIYVLIKEIISLVFCPVADDAYLYVTYKLICCFIEIPICCCYIYAYCKKSNITFDEVLYLLIDIGIVQLFIGIIMMFSPSIKLFLVNLMQLNNNSDIDTISSWEYNRRYFAFSGCMLDMFGWGFGIIAGLPFYIKNVKPKYLVISPFLLIIGVMNSTTTIIMYMVMLFGAFIKKLIIEHRVRKKLIILVGVIPLIFVIGFVVMQTYASGSFDWFMNEMMSLVGKSNSNKSSLDNVVDKNVWYFPNNFIDKLFGTGHYVYLVNGYKHSDIGFVNLIWISGIIGILILVITLIRTVKECCIQKKEYVFLFFVIFVIFWIFEIKGLGLGINAGMACTMIILMLSSI